MYTSIIALAATALLAHAAPLSNVVRTVTPTYPAYWNTSGLGNSTLVGPSSTGTPYSSGAPVPSSTPVVLPPPGQYGAPLATVYPEYTSQYNAATGAVNFHTARGYVSRNPKNGGADSTALVTFQLDKKYAANKCQLVFDLADPTSYVSGSKKAQLFTSLAPATASSSSWPSGNLRDQHLGTVSFNYGSRASWEAGSGPGASADGYFPCSDIAGKIYGGEVVPQGDSVEMSWPAGKDGVKILVW